MDTQPYVRELDNNKISQGVMGRIGCHFCREEPDVICDICLPVIIDGTYYGEVTLNTCVAHLEKAIAFDLTPLYPRYLKPDPPPQWQGRGWNYAHNFGKDYPRDQFSSGKWMVFTPSEKTVAWWNTVTAALQEGVLGRALKMSREATSRTYQGKTYHERVTCVYTYDSNDLDDVKRIREALRAIGVTEKISYKEDDTTLAGIYASSGKRVSKYRW